jgi:hypothetical protein
MPFTYYHGIETRRLIRLNSHNLASYLSLVAHALSALKSLSEQADRYVTAVLEALSASKDGYVPQTSRLPRPHGFQAGFFKYASLETASR